MLCRKEFETFEREEREAEEAEKRLDEAKAALYESTHVLNGKDEDMGHRVILGAMWIMTRLCARC